MLVRNDDPSGPLIPFLPFHMASLPHPKPLYEVGVTAAPRGFRAVLRVLSGGKTITRLLSPVVRPSIEDAAEDGFAEAARVLEGAHPTFA